MVVMVAADLAADLVVALAVAVILPALLFCIATRSAAPLTSSAFLLWIALPVCALLFKDLAARPNIKHSPSDAYIGSWFQQNLRWNRQGTWMLHPQYRMYSGHSVSYLHLFSTNTNHSSDHFGYPLRACPRYVLTVLRQKGRRKQVTVAAWPMSSSGYPICVHMGATRLWTKHSFWQRSTDASCLINRATFEWSSVCPILFCGRIGSQQRTFFLFLRLRWIFQSIIYLNSNCLLRELLHYSLLLDTLTT